MGVKTVEIVAYREAWAEEFERLAEVLREALGPLALRVDHIGSTSVPGLAAKDVIDIQVTVPHFEEPLESALASIGYTQRQDVTADHRPPLDSGPENDWEKRYFTPPPGQRPTHLHVRVAGRANQRYALLFRDYLHAHPPTAQAYAELKRRLAHYHAVDRAAYTDIKDPACDLIIHAAEAWAAQTGWQGATTPS